MSDISNTTRIAGVMTGMTTRIRVATVPAPDIRAASSIEPSRLRNAGVSSITLIESA